MGEKVGTEPGTTPPRKLSRGGGVVRGSFPKLYAPRKVVMGVRPKVRGDLSHRYPCSSVIGDSRTNNPPPPGRGQDGMFGPRARFRARWHGWPSRNNRRPLPGETRSYSPTPQRWEQSNKQGRAAQNCGGSLVGQSGPRLGRPAHPRGDGDRPKGFPSVTHFLNHRATVVAEMPPAIVG